MSATRIERDGVVIHAWEQTVQVSTPLGSVEIWFGRPINLERDIENMMRLIDLGMRLKSAEIRKALA